MLDYLRVDVRNAPMSFLSVVDMVFVELTSFLYVFLGIHVLTVLFIVALNGIPPNFGEPGTSTAAPPILREHGENPGDQIANDLQLATYNSLPI